MRNRKKKKLDEQMNSLLQADFNAGSSTSVYYTEQSRKLASLKLNLKGTKKQIKRTRRTKLAATLQGKGKSVTQFYDKKKMGISKTPSSKHLIGVRIGRKEYRKTDEGYRKITYNKQGGTRSKSIKAKKFLRAAGAVELGKRGTAGLGNKNAPGQMIAGRKVVGTISRNTNVKPLLSRKKTLKTEIKALKRKGIR